jgi:hypothetical protein
MKFRAYAPNTIDQPNGRFVPQDHMKVFTRELCVTTLCSERCSEGLRWWERLFAALLPWCRTRNAVLHSLELNFFKFATGSLGSNPVSDDGADPESSGRQEWSGRTELGHAPTDKIGRED